MYRYFWGILFVWSGSLTAWGEVFTLANEYASLDVASGAGGAVTRLDLGPGTGNLAAGGGLLQEGFGIGSFYVPNRRLNERTAYDRPDAPGAVTVEYDCDGPNIRGLHVTRTVKLVPGAASMRVQWTVENRGDQTQWLSPWVRNALAPGGSADAGDLLEVPSLSGLTRVTGRAYYAASRNWFAATDPAAGISVCGVFDANQAYAFLGEVDAEPAAVSVQPVFVPQSLAPGARWETVYRLNVYRGLTHVDFASDEIAVQIDYAPGRLTALVAAAARLPEMVFRARIRASNGDVVALPDKKFTVYPNHLARCSYDWTAPGDGAYEFLAQLEHAMKPYPLGNDTHSPHGGIDTQFVVGDMTEPGFEAWTDAPHALDRGPRQLKRALASSGPVAVWIDGPLEKIGRADEPVPTGQIDTTAELQLARNESESFQIVLRPPADRNVSDLRVTVHDLEGLRSGGTLPSSCVEVRRVGYVPVNVPTHFESLTGLTPDPLIPFAPFTAEGGECTPLWFTLYAPPGVAADTYTGMVEIAGNGIEPIELWIKAEVLDFDLPVTPALKTDFGYWPELAHSWCRRMGYPGTQDEVNERYLRDALRHRVTLRQLAQLPPERADYQRTLDAFTPKSTALKAAGASTFAVAPSLLQVPELLPTVNAYVLQQGLNGSVFCPFAGEPLRPAWPRLLEGLQQWHDAAPNIPTMVTTMGLEPFLPDLVDIWAVHTPVFDSLNGGRVLERIRNGGEVWMYVNHSPQRPYANFFLDFAAIEHRMLFWQAWALGVRGMHYWAVNYSEPGQNPYKGQLDITPANGNGFLVYPGNEGPVASIRWECIRDGIEDHDYLALLREKAEALKAKGGHGVLVQRAAAALDLESITSGLTAFTRDNAVLEQRRAEIGRLIVEANSALVAGGR